MKNFIIKNSKKENKVLGNKSIKKEEKLNIDSKGNLVSKNSQDKEDAKIKEKLVDLKNTFGFLCLIKDVRAFNLFEDCGFGGMSLYVNMMDNGNSDLNRVNGIYFYKENNYALKLKDGKLTWIDLWKAIDELVKLNGNTEEFIIDSFEIRESAGNRFYVKPIIGFNVVVDCGW